MQGCGSTCLVDARIVADNVGIVQHLSKIICDLKNIYSTQVSSNLACPQVPTANLLCEINQELDALVQLVTNINSNFPIDLSPIVNALNTIIINTGNTNTSVQALGPILTQVLNTLNATLRGTGPCAGQTISDIACTMSSTLTALSTELDTDLSAVIALLTDIRDREINIEVDADTINLNTDQLESLTQSLIDTQIATDPNCVGQTTADILCDINSTVAAFDLAPVVTLLTDIRDRQINVEVDADQINLNTDMVELLLQNIVDTQTSTNPNCLNQTSADILCNINTSLISELPAANAYLLQIRNSLVNNQATDEVEALLQIINQNITDTQRSTDPNCLNLSTADLLCQIRELLATPVIPTYNTLVGDFTPLAIPVVTPPTNVYGMSIINGYVTTPGLTPSETIYVTLIGDNTVVLAIPPYGSYYENRSSIPLITNMTSYSIEVGAPGSGIQPTWPGTILFDI